MAFKETKLKGAYLIELDVHDDERGFFTRVFCEKEFALHGISFHCVQCNISYNKLRGTLRGLHYQIAPYEEPKLIKVVKGSIYDVIVDLRKDSLTFHQWEAFELSERNQWMLYIPPGFAHGFQTLEDNTEILYIMGEYYHPEAARGIRWDDPFFKIKWPEISQRIIAYRDANYERVNSNCCE